VPTILSLINTSSNIEHPSNIQQGSPINEEVTNSFQGSVEGIEGSELLVDCTDTVNRNKDGDVEALGYLCSIQIDENLEIIGQDGKQIDVQYLKSNQVVEVIMDNPKKIGNSVGSRKIVAKKIIILTEE
jgi:hypothetical protein